MYARVSGSLLTPFAAALYLVFWKSACTSGADAVPAMAQVGELEYRVTRATRFATIGALRLGYGALSAGWCWSSTSWTPVRTCSDLGAFS